MIREGLFPFASSHTYSLSFLYVIEQSLRNSPFKETMLKIKTKIKSFPTGPSLRPVMLPLSGHPISEQRRIELSLCAKVHLIPRTDIQASAF